MQAHHDVVGLKEVFCDGSLLSDKARSWSLLDHSIHNPESRKHPNVQKIIDAMSKTRHFHTMIISAIKKFLKNPNVEIVEHDMNFQTSCLHS